jgi:hypothetical protein
MNGPTIKRKVHFASGRRSARQLVKGEAPAQPKVLVPIPRMARLMAFAIVFDDLLKSGQVADYAELPRLTGLDRSRITRIMNLRLLESGEQERMLLH